MMKKIYRKTLIVALVVLQFLPVMLPGQPDPGNNNGGGPLGGGAPIGGGLGILIVLAIGYGIKKWYDVNKRQLNE